MPMLHIVETTLEKVADVFELYLRDGITPLVLAVNIRQHARELRPFLPEAHEALSGLAAEIEAAAGDKASAKKAIRPMQKRYEAWRKDTLQRVRELEGDQTAQDASIAEAKRAIDERNAALVRDVEAAVAKRGQAVHEELAKRPVSTPAPAAPAAQDADAAAKKATAKEMAELGLDLDEDLGAEVEGMTTEDIEAILKNTTRKL